MYAIPFPFNDGDDPAHALLEALLDLLIPDDWEDGGYEDESDEDEEDTDDDGAMFLDPEDDEYGNEVTSGSTSPGWTACPVSRLPSDLAAWTRGFIGRVPGGEVTGPAVAAASREQVHYHLGVDILGTRDWRAAFPLHLQDRTGWLVIEWSAGDDDVPPPLPRSGLGCLLFGVEEDELPALLCRRLRARLPA